MVPAFVIVALAASAAAENVALRGSLVSSELQATSLEGQARGWDGGWCGWVVLRSSLISSSCTFLVAIYCGKSAHIVMSMRSIRNKI